MQFELLRGFVDALIVELLGHLDLYKIKVLSLMFRMINAGSGVYK